MIGSFLLLYMFAVIIVALYLYGISPYDRRLTKSKPVRVVLLVFAPVSIVGKLLYWGSLLLYVLAIEAVVIATGARRKPARR